MPSTTYPTPTIPLTLYLFTRLTQLHCTHLHGVPGDYNLTMLDHLHHPDTNPSSPLHYIGSCNELNAGYAADGYARIKGLGALITAFGVGELSAVNAIGGAYAEGSRVVHIVGTPPRAAQRGGVCLHHSFGHGDFGVGRRVAREVTVAQANLVEEGEAAQEIDRVLRECVVKGRPVYIEVPTDMVNIPVDKTRLEKGIMEPDPDVGDATQQRSTKEEQEEKAREKVITRLLARMGTAKQPFLIIDGFSARYSIFSELESLVTLLGWPTTATPFGKSCINEALPNFHGIYAGLAGKAVYKPWVESCDLVLRFGGLDSDVNTYGFSTLTPEKVTVNLWGDRVVFGDDGTSVEGVGIKLLLRGLLQRLSEMEKKGGIPRMDPYPSHLGDPRAESAALPPPEPETLLQQHDFWVRVSRFFREGDVILTETGTPSVGSREFVLPKNARLINSSIWLSIGFMLAASQGAALAVRKIREDGEKGSEQNWETDNEESGLPMPVLSAQTASGRTILFEGDGSFQMTVQELSTIIRHKLDLVLFLINNDGYTIERFIHGMRAHYNEVARWRYLDAPRFFGAGLGQGADMNGVDDGDLEGAVNGESVEDDDSTNCVDGNGSRARESKAAKGPEKTEYKIQTYQARTWGELLPILSKPSVQAGKGLCMIEVFMDREDAPDTLKKLVRNVRKRNSGESERAANGADDAEEETKIETKVVEAAG
jgi:pyruvate decarboxylase